MQVKVLYILLIALMICSCALYAGESSNGETIKRYVFAIGANHGGTNRVQLRYAESDAKAMVKVLQEMGGVFPGDSVLLKQPDQATINEQFSDLSKRVTEARKKHARVEVIFYYSGHSGKKSLYLGEERMLYKQLGDLIEKIDAHVKITILDSCASGTFTRIKGVKPRPPFMLNRANNMKGYAIMTSCSSKETSQESDYLKGSFFTHNLIAGLRGAADVIQDGRVTLNEAYQFAFGQTLAKTDKTFGGPQHPHYNIQMKGTGDVVMTDIRESSGLITFHEDISGKLLVWDDNDMLVIELKKIQGKLLKIGLDQGKYRIVNIFGGKVYELTLALKDKKQVLVAHDGFKSKDPVKTRKRGTQVLVLEQMKHKSTFFPYLELNYYSSWGPAVNLGFTMQRGFSLGLFSRYDGKIGNGGLSFAYAFARRKLIHFKVGMTYTVFSINMPEANTRLDSQFQLIWKINKNLRLGAGFVIPIMVEEGSSDPSVFCSLRFGN